MSAAELRLANSPLLRRREQDFINRRAEAIWRGTWFLDSKYKERYHLKPEVATDTHLPQDTH